MGLERILILMEKQNCEFPIDDVADVYIAPMGENATAESIKLCNKLREEGFTAVTDLSGRGLKAQMKYANKIGAKFSMVIGDNELENKKATLKNMITGENQEIDLPDGLSDAIYKAGIDNILAAAENL